MELSLYNTIMRIYDQQRALLNEDIHLVPFPSE